MPNSTLRIWRRVRAVAWAGACVAALALAACSGQRAAAPAVGAQLFARGLDEIDDLYLEPVSNRRLAVAGAQRLSRLDNKFAVSDTLGSSFGAALTVSYNSRNIDYLALPEGKGGRSWGDLLARVIATARRVSPRIAALPKDRVETAVFDGMTSALDRFSRYEGPRVARDARAARDGFGGVGIVLDTNDQLLRVASVSPHSPAARAGIQPEDQIVAINGVTTKGCSHAAAVHRLRGPIGSSVALEVLRPGSATAQEMRLRRAFVTMPTVSMTEADGIAIFRITSFNRTTGRRLAEKLAAAERQAGGHLKGIVLDLRSNPGGLLDQAVKVAKLFISKGPIVSTVGRNPASHQYFAASGHAMAPHLPIAVLINGGSASASEIVAAALQDTGRAVVIGSASYGKGTVQTVLRLPNTGELIVTWARLVTPSGYLLQHNGVVPTLCTARLPAGAGSLATELQQAAASAVAGEGHPRAALNARGWAALRRSCPPLRTRPAIDLKLAKRLLADPTLYSEAVHMLPTATRVAAAPLPAAAMR